MIITSIEKKNFFLTDFLKFILSFRPNSPDRIIIHKANSVATSVKLYERHKLIAEELFKLKQARIHNHYVKLNKKISFFQISIFLDCYRSTII